MVRRNPNARIAELEDDVKQKDSRIAELKIELDEARSLVERQNELVQDVSDTIEQWKEAFEMELRDDGTWGWRQSFVEGDEWYARYAALLKKWNRFVPEYNAAVAPRLRNVGRPPSATPAQRDEVLRLHGAGRSLRGIAEETGLGLQAVRTVVDQRDRVDRTSKRHLERIKRDMGEERTWNSRARIRKALPRRINALQKQAAELTKEAKGLK